MLSSSAYHNGESYSVIQSSEKGNNSARWFHRIWATTESSHYQVCIYEIWVEIILPDDFTEFEQPHYQVKYEILYEIWVEIILPDDFTEFEQPQKLHIIKCVYMKYELK